MKTIIEENNELLNSLPALTGNAAKLAHRLSETTDRLEKLIKTANDYFRIENTREDSENKEAIDAAQKGLNS